MTSRRLVLSAGLAAAAAALAAPAAASKKPAWPAKPSVPTDLNAEELFTELAAHGTGIRVSEVPGAPTVFVCFDTQCQWCVWEEAQFAPYAAKVNFVYFPVAVLNPWSERQAAWILSQKDPVKAFEEHRAHFRDAAFKGVDVRKADASTPMSAREAVWENTKIARRAAVREVPFGVMKTVDGRYVPVPEMTGPQFGKLAGIEL